jgi:hypothetical protein
MTTKLDLKEIEKRAYRSTYQDGLLDICFGLIVVSMAVSLHRPATGFSFMNTLLSMGGILVANVFFLVGKKYITAPRLGQVVFGEVRKRKTRTMIIVLSVFVFFQVILLGITSMGWLNDKLSNKLNLFLGEHDMGLLVVASIGSLIVGCGMVMIAYFTDFSRGFYIAILMAITVFLMIFMNEPLLPILIGAVILVPGIFLLVRFLNKYPLRLKEDSHE